MDLFHNGYGRDFALQRIPASIATSYCSVEAATIVLLREIGNLYHRVVGQQRKDRIVSAVISAEEIGE
jgi:hypothetical protein